MKNINSKRAQQQRNIKRWARGSRQELISPGYQIWNQIAQEDADEELIIIKAIKREKPKIKQLMYEMR